MRCWLFLALLVLVAACSAFSGSDTAADGRSVEGEGGIDGADGAGAGLEGGAVFAPDAPGPPDATLGGGVAIDCTNESGSFFCNDFDGHTNESQFQPNNGSVDAGVSSAHVVSPTGALLIDTIGYVIFTGDTGSSPWTISFDVYLDASVPIGRTFANITRLSQVSFTTAAGGVTVNQTLFSAPKGWAHVVIQTVIKGGLQVTVNAVTQPIGFSASTAPVELKLGNFTGPGPIWFDDVLCTQ